MEEKKIFQAEASVWQESSSRSVSKTPLEFFICETIETGDDERNSNQDSQHSAQ